MQRDGSLPVSFRPRQAKEIAAVDKQSLLRYEKEFPDFPKPSRPTPRVTIYNTERVLAWLDTRRGVPA